MKNRMKKVSALVLAATMAMGTYTSAFAADMTVYIRSFKKNTTTPKKETSFVVRNVDSSMSIYEALEKAPTAVNPKMLDNGVTLHTDWNYVSDTDDYYLTSLNVTNADGNYKETNDGRNTKLYYDDEDNIVGGFYEGNSWMWCPMTGNLYSTDYPEDITLSDQKCKDTDFSIILSYDYFSFPWGDTTGEGVDQ